MEQPSLLAPQTAEQGQDPWPQAAKVRFEWLTLGIRTSASGRLRPVIHPECRHSPQRLLSASTSVPVRPRGVGQLGGETRSKPVGHVPRSNDSPDQRE